MSERVPTREELLVEAKDAVGRMDHPKPAFDGDEEWHRDALRQWRAERAEMKLRYLAERLHAALARVAELEASMQHDAQRRWVMVEAELTESKRESRSFEQMVHDNRVEIIRLENLLKLRDENFEHLRKTAVELERDCELFRAFLWDDHDETWPEDVHAALHRALERLGEGE